MKDFDNSQLCFQAEIGWRLRDKRRERGLTQTELGARMGVHRNTIMRWEEGTTLTLWEFLRICDELSIQFHTVLPARQLYVGQMLRTVISEREGPSFKATLSADDRKLLAVIKAERDPPLHMKEISSLTLRKRPASVAAREMGVRHG